MQVRDIMTQEVESIRPDGTINEAAGKMLSRDIGFLPVEQDGIPVGVLTDRDIVLRVIAAGRDVNFTSVKDVMTVENLVTCYPEDSVAEVCEKMEINQIRRLIVVDDDNNICGVVSMGDIAVKTEDSELVFEAIEKVCEPGRNRL